MFLKFVTAAIAIALALYLLRQFMGKVERAKARVHRAGGDKAAKESKSGRDARARPRRPGSTARRTSPVGSGSPPSRGQAERPEGL